MEKRKARPHASYKELSTNGVTIWRGMEEIELPPYCCRLRIHNGYIQGDHKFRRFIEFQCEGGTKQETYTYRLDKETFYGNHKPILPSSDQQQTFPIPNNRLVISSASRRWIASSLN